jgi:hypothetical protein
MDSRGDRRHRVQRKGQVSSRKSPSCIPYPASRIPYPFSRFPFPVSRFFSYLAGMRPFRKKLIAYFLGLFALPKVREVVAGYARAFMGEAGRYSAGIRTEAVETRDTFTILAKYIKKEKISREEKKQFKKQVFDILRSSGVMVPVMLFPAPFVGTLLLIIMDHLLLSMNIHLLPDSFYQKDKKDLLTTEGVENDLKTL